MYGKRATNFLQLGRFLCKAAQKLFHNNSLIIGLIRPVRNFRGLVNQILIMIQSSTAFALIGAG